MFDVGVGVSVGLSPRLPTEMTSKVHNSYFLQLRLTALLVDLLHRPLTMLSRTAVNVILHARRQQSQPQVEPARLRSHSGF